MDFLWNSHDFSLKSSPCAKNAEAREGPGAEAAGRRAPARSADTPGGGGWNSDESWCFGTSIWNCMELSHRYP